MAIKAMTLVYLRESSLRKKERGITISLERGQPMSRVEKKKDFTPRGKHAHKRRNPKMPVHKVTDFSSVLIEAQDDAGHQVSDDDQVANSDSKALDRNGCIEHYRGVRVGDLRECKERGRATVDVLGAACLKVQTEARCDAGPHDDEGSEEYAHLRHGSRHGQDSGADDCDTVNFSPFFAWSVERSYLYSPN